MPRRRSSARYLSPVAAALVALVAGACGLDLTGTSDGTFDGGGAGAGPDAPTKGDLATADSATDAPGADDGVPDSEPPPVDAKVPDARRPDACTDGGCDSLQTCKQWVAVLPPPATDGTYTVDPDGPGPKPSIPVQCNMTLDGGGWTLVGRELVSGQGQFRYLDTDSGNPPGIASGTQSGLIGARFVGLYSEVWIDWSASGNYVRFTRPANFDLFANVVNTAVPVSQFSTSETSLNGWVLSASGAKLCVASHDNDVRPGDSSWAILPLTDNNTGCGCDSSGWRGQGAYYGGTPNGSQTACTGWGGGWAGVKDDTVPKGGIVPNYETRIWIR
jgi:hypothetical protein